MAGRRFVLLAMSLVAFFSYLAVGMIAPFLPQHLKALGLSERWSGVIFACYPVAMISSTPLCNKLVAHYGRVPLIVIGLVIQAAATYVFGSWGDRLSVLLVSRAAQGCGASASNLAMFSLVADLFEESLGRVMGLSETVIGAGFSIGPLVGGLLFTQGGFPLPFTACSGVLVVVAALMPVMLPAGTSSAAAKAANGSAADGSSAFSRLRSACTWKLLAPAGLLLQGTMVWGVVDSGFYTVHAANDLGLDQTVIGVNLAAASGAFSAAGLLAGVVADHIGYGLTMLCGASTSAVSLLLVGPAALPAATIFSDALAASDRNEVQRWYECCALVLLGLGQAFMLIPSLGAMKAAVPKGDSSATEACVSLFNAFQQAGLVFGPLASAALGAQYALGNSIIASVVLCYVCLTAPTMRGVGKAQGGALGDALLGQGPPSPRVSQFSPMSHQLSPSSDKQRCAVSAL